MRDINSQTSAPPVVNPAAQPWVSVSGSDGTSGLADTLSSESLFRALDGRWIAVAGERWRAEVYGIRQDGGWRWVQLGLHGTRDYMLTLRASQASGISQLILALNAWLAGTEPGQGMLIV